MTRTRRALLVSFFYPPDPAVGGRRVESFARYLPEFGWEVEVLTSFRPEFGRSEDSRVHEVPYSPVLGRGARKGGREAGAGQAPSTGGPGTPPPGPVTPSFNARLGGGTLGKAVYRGLRHLLPLSVSRLPDATGSWIRPARRAGTSILAGGSFDLIFSTHGPTSSHRVAFHLARALGIPWVADFRDLWSGNHADPRVPPFAAGEELVERRVLSGSRLITTVSPPWARRLAALHGKPAEVVYNGFDEAVFPPETARPEPGLSLLYVGTLHPHGHDLRPLWRAVRKLAEDQRGEMKGVGFSVRFLGTDSGAVLPLAREEGVAEWVRILSPVSPAEAVSLQRRAPALLLSGWSGEEGLLPVKVFEYLGARRPILGVGAPGDPAGTILEECGQGRLLHEAGEIARRLSGWLGTVLESGLLEGPPPSLPVEGYTRRAQAGRLARVLASVVRQEGTAPPGPQE